MIEENGRKQKGRKTGYILAVFGCLAVLSLAMCLGHVLYSWLSEADRENQQALAALHIQGEAMGTELESEAETEHDEEELPLEQDSKEELYSEEEVNLMIAQAREEAGVAAREALVTELQISLENGSTVVEALRGCFTDRLVLASSGKYYFLPIRTDLSHNSYIEENLRLLENGELEYVEKEEVVSHKGIDVSKFQGRIDWDKVAADGVEFAIIRVGYRGYGENGTLAEDETFEANIKGALAAGIRTGVYFYSQALNEEELMEEAQLVLEKIAPYEITGPVVYDVEKTAGDGRMNSLSVEERTRLTKLFCETMKEAGYRPMIYHNMEMALLMLDLTQLKEYDKWFAYYNPELYYPYEYTMWQYTDKGTVNGIEGEVDLNISFVPWED
ncbi:MAG: glycoside hydrolase family 25 protein [Roseburia sp.]|nr:glycoside hydrolase family 25 protein [Roseburia sp.]